MSSVAVGSTTTTVVVVDVGPGTVTITVDVYDGVGCGSVVVGAAEVVDGLESTVWEVGAQGVPISLRLVVTVIQASCDSSDMISALMLSAAAGSSVTM